MSSDKDWTGNKATTFSTLGASNHSEHERQQDDYYATDPSTIKPLFDNEEFAEDIWENACGEGHLSEVISKHGHIVYSTDIVDRKYKWFDGVVDFLKVEDSWNGDIITNPPYKYAKEFTEKALSILKPGKKLAMFLKLQFLEGQKRQELFKLYPPKTIYVFSARQKCALNGDFKGVGSSAVAYAWFVWEKGFKGDPIVKWI